MIRKLFLSRIRAFTLILDLILTVLFLNVLSIPVYAAEPEDDTVAVLEETADEEPQSAEDDMSKIKPLTFHSVPSSFADNTEDQNYIIVEKTFSNLPVDLIPDDFQVMISSGGGNRYTLNKDNTIGRTIDTEGNVIWRWKITDVGTGTYTVSESGENVSNYTVTKIGGGTVEIKAADMTVLVPVHETTCSHTNWPVRVDGDSNVLFAATLTQGGVAVISESPLSASQRAAVSQAVLKINGPWKSPVYFYSIEEQLLNGTGFELNGATITYNPAEEEIVIGQTRNWQHVATLEYSISEASSAEIILNNIYTRSTADVTVCKKVTGNMTDFGKSFDFTVSVIANGAGADFTMNGITYTGNASFSLKHGESVLLENIPIGAQLTVAEADYSDERYNTSYTVDYQKTVVGSVAVIPEVTENGYCILFTNQKEFIPDTGIRLDTLPYIMILAAIIVASSIKLIHHHSKRKDK